MRNRNSLKVYTNTHVILYSVKEYTIHLSIGELTAEHGNEMEDMRKTLSFHEDTVENQRGEMCRLEQEVEQKKAELSSLKNEQVKQVEQLSQEWETKLQTQLKQAKAVSL